MRLERTLFGAAVVALVFAGGSLAQQTPEETPKPAEKKQLRVLKDPHEISSFYRSKQESGYLTFSPYGVYPSTSGWNYGPGFKGESGYWRGLYGSYSGFWSGGGYGQYYRNTGRKTPYRRGIGGHGDLFLMAPVLLAPVGPLAGAYFEAPAEMPAMP
jgi:hypothetical protein